MRAKKRNAADESMVAALDCLLDAAEQLKAKNIELGLLMLEKEKTEARLVMRNRALRQALEYERKYYGDPYRHELEMMAQREVLKAINDKNSIVTEVKK